MSFTLTPPSSSSHHPATNAGQEKILQACAAEFGAAIDEKSNLFEVSLYYLLEVKFDDSGRLTQLGVLPKHWFADKHPEWDQTDDVGELTVVEYAALLGRLERIRPKGRLIRRAKQPVVKATTATRRDRYTRAVLQTDDVADSRRPENAPRAIKYFVVYFATPK